jgi:N-acetylglucosaminyl-diphospho-decaprenol L-rhamnosyltransferase
VEPPKLSAVIPTLNGGDHLERCLNALESADDIDEVLVLDGGSTDGSPERAAAREGIRVLSLPDTPFLQRYNHGVELARNELVLVLNDDAFVDPKTPRLLATAVLEHPRMALCGANLRYENGLPQPSGGHYRTLLQDILATLGLSRMNDVLRRGKTSQKESGIEKVTWMPYCAAVLRRSAFLEIGGFDERFSFYFDDHDTCRRLVQAGWELGVRWDAGAVHVGGGTTRSKDPPAWFGSYQENRFVYLRKHYPRSWRIGAVLWAARAFLHVVLWRLRAVRERLRSNAEGERVAREWFGVFRRSAWQLRWPRIGT